jgi:ERCC4-related helicase
VDGDDYNAEQLEQAEEELLDAATAAQTIAELEAELLDLSDLAALAKRVRDLGTDRKWTELSTILQEHAIPTMRDGQPRKIIIFTEHRDTLDYLRARISSLLGNPMPSVIAIHGGVRRARPPPDHRGVHHNPECQVLLATDAAGEGLNLQAAT